MDVARGGHIEPDDDPVQAVLREIEEETGLLAEIIPIHQSVSFTYPEQLPARLYNHRSSAETSGRQRRRGDSHRTTSPSAPAHHNVAPDSPAGFADTTRIVVDLNAVDGLKVGSLVSLRRDRIPIVHPVTGELLGELDEEVGTARIVELREKFSVAEIQSVSPGSQIQVKDRVVQK